MKRFFVAADVRRLGDVKPFLPAWEAIEAPDADSAWATYSEIYRAKGYEVDKLLAVKAFTSHLTEDAG